MRPRLASSLLVATCLLPAPSAHDGAPRNLVLLISDGCGDATLTLARNALGRPLALDAIRTGAVDTASSDSLITDSAASATAYASGIRTTNGAIGVDASGRSVPTLLELAERRGLATGLVTTTRITHATPACFAAHVPERSMENEIAAQLLDAGVEVLFGGGIEFFRPKPLGERDDGRDLLAEARDAGVTLLDQAEQLDGLEHVPVLGLFGRSHLAYEVDREAPQPSLTQMAETAWRLLAADPDGFFLMVEGGRIDHAAHGNDPVGHLHDALAYDAMVTRILELARADGDTLVVSTSDHETGGLTLGRVTDGESTWNYDPQVLLDVSISVEGLADALVAGRDPLEVLDEAGLGSFRGPERDLLLRAIAEHDTSAVRAAWTELLGRRSGVGWTTLGHTGVDVPLFADGPGAEHVRGTLRNDELGRLLAELLPAGAGEPVELEPRSWHDADAPGRLRR